MRVSFDSGGYTLSWAEYDALKAMPLDRRGRFFEARQPLSRGEKGYSDGGRRFSFATINRLVDQGLAQESFGGVDQTSAGRAFLAKHAGDAQ